MRAIIMEARLIAFLTLAAGAAMVMWPNNLIPKVIFVVCIFGVITVAGQWLSLKLRRPMLGAILLMYAGWATVLGGYIWYVVEDKRAEHKIAPPPPLREEQVPDPPPEAFEEGSLPFPQFTFGCWNFSASGELLESLESGKETPFLTIRNGDEGLAVPISLYIKSGVLYANITLYSPRTNLAVILNNNKVSRYVPDWDTNFNNRVVEVIDDNGVVALQLIRLGKMRISIQGFVRAYGVVTIFGGTGQPHTVPAGSFSLDANFLPKLFMYPSYQYQGRLIEPPLARPECPSEFRGGVAMTSRGIVLDAKKFLQDSH